ncbi:MAG: UDP-3-O-acyl-N-acetylglucosamine deacetylase [Rickettsiales bacterium]|jgi:UDP-3-O-acyl-N-acetylglucosamine deacetylase|nr:UDP-3-O-acyl-N-acetylglucosamine deacetylase [Rickettsiales bacterium]
MYNGKQTTISFKVFLFGKTKDNKKLIEVALAPANINDGIVFKRTDINKKEKLNFDNVKIENGSICCGLVKNIEQLLIAVWANKIDNLIVEINGDTMPYLEGHSEQISFILSTAQTESFDISRNVFELKKKIKNDFLIIKPSTTFSIVANGFLFDNKIHPYKNFLAFVKKEDKEYQTLFTLALLFIGGFSLLDVEITKFAENEIFETIKTLFNGK